MSLQKWLKFWPCWPNFIPYVILQKWFNFCHVHTLAHAYLTGLWHYDDVIMTTLASQITSLAIVYSIVYSDADQRKHQSSASLAFVWGIHRDRWIPCTKGQLRGKCFHLMTSSWVSKEFLLYLEWDGFGYLGDCLNCVFWPAMTGFNL